MQTKLLVCSQKMSKQGKKPAVHLNWSGGASLCVSRSFCARVRYWHSRFYCFHVSEEIMSAFFLCPSAAHPDAWIPRHRGRAPVEEEGRYRRLNTISHLVWRGGGFFRVLCGSSLVEGVLVLSITGVCPTLIHAIDKHNPLAQAFRNSWDPR